MCPILSHTLNPQNPLAFMCFLVMSQHQYYKILDSQIFGLELSLDFLQVDLKGIVHFSTKLPMQVWSGLWSGLG